MLQLLWQLLLRVWCTFIAAKLKLEKELGDRGAFLASNGAVDARLFWLTIGPHRRHRPCVLIRGSELRGQKNNPSQESTSLPNQRLQAQRCSYEDTGDSTTAALASAETRAIAADTSK